jgi:hypothetical protein
MGVWIRDVGLQLLSPASSFRQTVQVFYPTGMSPTGQGKLNVSDGLLPFLLYLFICGAGDGNQGLTHAR